MACTDSTGFALFYLFVGYLLGVMPYWVEAWKFRSKRPSTAVASIDRNIAAMERAAQNAVRFRRCLCSVPVMDSRGFCKVCGGVDE